MFDRKILGYLATNVGGKTLCASRFEEPSPIKIDKPEYSSGVDFVNPHACGSFEARSPCAGTMGGHMPRIVWLCLGLWEPLDLHKI